MVITRKRSLARVYKHIYIYTRSCIAFVFRFSISNTEIFIFYTCSYILKAFLMKDWRFFIFYAESDIITDILSSSKSQLVHLNHIMLIMCRFFRKRAILFIVEGVIKTRGDFQLIQLKKWIWILLTSFL
jgi:hypothetical protein